MQIDAATWHGRAALGSAGLTEDKPTSHDFQYINTQIRIIPHRTGKQRSDAGVVRGVAVLVKLIAWLLFFLVIRPTVGVAAPFLVSL